MAIPLRSNETTQGRRMAGARALWRANGMTEEQIGKPIIAVVNSFTQFVPGHVHLHEIGQQVKKQIEAQAALPPSSTPSPLMTASPWATTACSIPCPPANSSPIP